MLLGRNVGDACHSLPKRKLANLRLLERWDNSNDVSAPQREYNVFEPTLSATLIYARLVHRWTSAEIGECQSLGKTRYVVG